MNDKGGVTVFLVYKRAFETIDGLVEKLKMLGFRPRAMKRFESYFEGRMQSRVKVMQE